MRRLLRAAAAGLLGGALIAAAGVASAGAQVTDDNRYEGIEHVVDLRVDMSVATDGALSVTERVMYDFGATPRRGIFRYVPIRYRFDDKYDRVLRISDVSVTSTDAPPDLKQYEQDNSTVLRIGDPNRTVTGVRNYQISYTLRGVMNGFPDHDELFWNIVGDGWNVPIANVTANVTMPAPITAARCESGALVSQPCPEANVDGPRGRFRARDLAVGSAMTIAVAIPTGVLNPAPKPILEERWSLQRAFTIDATTVGLCALLAVLLIGGVATVLWRGRDRQFTGSAVDAAFGNASGSDEAVGLFERANNPIEFVPPDNIRPGQVGTLIDEVANPLDVVATIVDLAVRGYLRIEQVGESGMFKKPDWNLLRLGKSTTNLLRYEQELLGAVFRSGEQVQMSTLRNHFAADLRAVQSDLYDDVVKEGWYAIRPDKTRSTWNSIRFLSLLAVGGISWALIAWTTFALLCIPLWIAWIVFALGVRNMPSRTARGTAMVRRVFGFRELFTEPEVARQKWAENHNIFSEYLPYAIVFGLTEKWANAFEGLGIDPAAATAGWYVSPYPFMWADFGHQVDSFTVMTSGTLVSTPAAATGASGFSGFSGGGFSGGGFGGGGGGSW